MSATATLPGLPFLRPFAARQISSTATSPLTQRAYLHFYQTVCAVTGSGLRKTRPWRRTTRQYATASATTVASDHVPTSNSRAAKALRVQELTEADALHYPRYQPASLAGGHISIAEFCTEFASVAVGDEVPHRRVELAGRVLSVQRLGAKLIFLRLLDNGEQVQVMCNLRQLRTVDTNQPVEAAAFKTAARLLNRGDHVAVTGRAMRTSAGELTLAADVLPCVYSRALRPLPSQLVDADKRALRRHVDLLVNPPAAATLRLRAHILREMRHFFEDQQFVEVQTPILADLAGGAVARPFMTAHADESVNATSAGARALSLRIAPELWLKRLVVGGLDRVFEIGPAFRNEGIDSTHNPEFSMCEFYATYWTLPRLIAETRSLMAQLAQAALQFRATTAGVGLQAAGHNTNSTSIGKCAAGGPFVQLEFVPSLEAALGITFPDLSAHDAYEQLRKKLGIKAGPADTGDADGGRLAKLLDRLASEYLEPRSFADADGPLFITNHPACMSPLAKSFVCPRTGQTVTARAELFVDGRELANMYEEENDPVAQRRKMKQQVEDTKGRENRSNAVDENYIAALEAGLPPTGGWGCGIERLVMLFSGARRIADCLSFGTLRHVVSMKE
ncbi:mitochondrial lysine-tRNA synthetase [Sporothrix epigloea]|uniref:Lysyl-tRNA synthetase n=1 Tax=Sporothrix epigloea TaxID=1892477 RepID=A0ABP0DXJ8_9PEZI